MKSKTKSRNLSVRKALTLHLPEDYPWKVLSKLALDLKEYLAETDYERIAKITRHRDFEAYLELAEAWGLQSIVSTDIAPAEMRAKYLLASLIKKFQFPTDKDQRVARATKVFLEAEAACKTYNQVGYESLTEPETEFGAAVLKHAKLFLVKLLGASLPGHRALLDRSRHGPGATIGTKNGNTSQYHKFAEWPYSCTIDAFRYARFAIETDPRWLGALQNSYRARFGIPKHYPLDLDAFWARVIKVVDGNRITFVPKDALKERTIAIEPTLNLYLQLGVDGFIRRRLKRFGVDLDSQEKNQELARLGSLGVEAHDFVTVDLSAASDSISTKLCEILLPADWYSYLMALRSPCGELDGDNVNYEKVSSMGNGYTFALESAIFAAITYAVTKAGGGSFDHKRFAIFGDDIIVEKRWYFMLVEALRLSGFRINLEKTFSSGPIRESCGTDWFQGLPVRPVFLDKTPADAMELFCDYNRIKRLLSLRWGLEVSKTLDLLAKWIPDAVKNCIGPLSDEDFDSYIHREYPEKGMYQRWVYKFKRLIMTPLPRNGREFLFRKLMHDLRGKPIGSHQWVDRKVSGAGSRFIVTCRNAVTMRYTYSVASDWQNQYAEYDPPRVFHAAG